MIVNGILPASTLSGTPLVSPLWGSMPTAGEEAGGASGASGASFANIFQYAIDAVKESDAEKTQAQYLMATGQLDNPAQLTLAASKYELSVSLLVQLRNKAVETYNELMRISL